MRILNELDELRVIADRNPDANLFQGAGELLRHQPQVTIVKLAGRARAGGAEFIAAADMTFAARKTAGIGQSEVLMGIVPGNGGTQYLRERVGRNRTLELLLTGDLVDADTAAAYGWINRAVPAAELDAFVDGVAGEDRRAPPGAHRCRQAVGASGGPDRRPTCGKRRMGRVGGWGSAGTAHDGGVGARCPDPGGQERSGVGHAKPRCRPLDGRSRRERGIRTRSAHASALDQ
ncbi:enoyl-CoA hydratase/isomerase family protein [Streptomyces sp. H23]|uniref:enoyl-CoA hydratase/isomerase family protein n=1 Tax=Streptomyces sp. H23 TaxID=2541723 RepID=UPI001F0F1EF4|nr:enoyl-CoA hydratase/isomerase family protein [Streptomyces sp. H23]